ncbi:hypothetical protein Tco_0174682 [Tanacetum coccineum]
MSDLKFAHTHNLVAFLEKPTESEGFKEIVDFLNANPIKHALTVNPTIYCSCVKQFWDTVKAKMVNGEVQLQALVDKKKVFITESTIRRDLQLEDANGVDCLPNATIFEQLTLTGKSKKKNTEVPQASSSTDNVPNENVPTTSNDPLLSDSEIASLKKKVKKLEMRNKLRTPRLKRRMHPNREEIVDIDADVEEIEVKKVVSTAEVTTESATTTTINELTLAQTLIEIKAVKPKVRGVMIQEPSEFTTTTTTTTPATSKPSQDNGKAKMIESKKPLKKKDQIMYYQESKLFVQLLEAIKKHFAEMRAREKRNKPPTQAQQRKLYCSKKRAEDSTKRAGTKLEQKVAKKQKIDDAKVDDDQEEARMKELMNIVPDEEKVAINAIPLATKPPFIRRFGNIVETESLMWRTLQNEKVLIWKLFNSCGAHFLRLQSMIFCMLNKKLQADHWNEMCYQLFKLITKQLKNPESERIVGMKSFIRLFEITVALIKVSVAQEEKCTAACFRVNAAGTKLQLLTELQLLMDKD